jgi:hypothetical protein
MTNQTEFNNIVRWLHTHDDECSLSTAALVKILTKTFPKATVDTFIRALRISALANA